MIFNQPIISNILKVKQRLYEKYSKLHHIELFEEERVLILSPHPDDDVIGCTGAIKKHLDHKAEVKIIYICSGDKGGSGKDLTTRRQKEAVDALKYLHVEDTAFTFLNHEDEAINIEKAVNQIQQIISSFNPEIVYLPSFIDNHIDHFATNKILAWLEGIDTIRGYEIWTPTVPNRLIDISDLVEVKKEAIGYHKSQLTEVDYISAILGLNQYRAALYTKKKMSFAEGYLEMSFTDYKSFIQSILDEEK